MDYNLNDYTKLGQTVSSQEVLLQKTYRLLGLSFIPAAIGAGVSMKFNPLASLQGNAWIVIGITFAFFYGMCFLIEKNRYSNVGASLLMVFTFGMGILIGPLLNYSAMFSNGTKLVMLAALMTAGIFITMSIMARKSSIQTNRLGQFLSVGGIVIMVGVVANLFIQAPVFSLVLSAVFVLFSSLVIMWQIRNIIEGGEDSYISAALTIFISIYNVFSSLLRLLLAFAGEE